MSPLRSHPSPLLRKSAVSYNRRCFQGRTSMALFAKYSKYEDTDRVKKNRKRKGSKSRWEDEDDNEYLPQTDQEEKNRNKNDLPVEDLFLFNVEECTKAIKLSVEELVAAQTWDPKTLEAEKEGSCWKYRDDLERAIQAINEGLVEREEEARLVLLAMVSMEHIILVGVPGTGKSVLGRRLAKLCDGFFFQRLLTKFSTPEELFGPLSLKSLENDEYRRCTTGYLPTASVAFLDEIFKANSAILNTLLTILNERKFDNAGGQELCPIKCVVGASNELPESDELVALFDRFLIRKEVLPVSDQGVLTMLSMTNLGCEERETCKIDVSDSLNEVIGALSIAVNYVSIEDEVCLIVRDLRKFMREVHSVEISDRRLVKAAGMLKISAASNGREKVDPIDCLLLQHCMWQLPEQRVFVRDWLWDHITPGCEIKQLRFLLDNIRSEVLEIVRKTSGDISGAFGGRESDISLIESSRIETSRIISILQKSRADLSRHIELIHKANEFLWLDPDETKSLQQLLLPRAEKTLVEVEQALSDSTALQLCLQPSSQSPSNDLRFSVIENLWAEGYTPEISFTEEELSIGMKEAKKRFDLKTFRKWKRSKKLAEK